MINNIIKKAVQNGEVSPPPTPLLNTPKSPEVSVSKVVRDLKDAKVNKDSVQLLADELRLNQQHKTLDEAIKADFIAQKRKEIGWDNMTYEQKKQRDFFKEMEMSNRKFEFDMITDPINKLRKQVPTMSLDQLNAKKLELEQGGFPLTERVKNNIAKLGVIVSIENDNYNEVIDNFISQLKSQAKADTILTALSDFRNFRKVCTT